MKKIKVKKENGELVCEPTDTPANRGEEIVWVPVNVGADVKIFFEERSPFTDRRLGPFLLSDKHTIRMDAESGHSKFKHIKGDIIID